MLQSISSASTWTNFWACFVSIAGGGVWVGLWAVGLKIGDKGGCGSEERWKQKSCHGIMGGPALTPPWVSPLLLQTPADLFKVLISLSS